jgi:hypothetical protein
MAQTNSLAFSRFTVDLWLTDINDVEIGFFRQSRHRAKSRQFSKDSDVIGEVDINGERAGLLTYRRGAWNEAQGMKRRLVVKLFSPEMSWRGSMECLLGRSLQLTIGAHGLPVLCFSVNISGHDQIIQVERSAHKWPLMPEDYSFFISEDRKAHFYRLRRDWISIGQDYTLYDAAGVTVGHLNGRVLDLGGRWDVKLREDHDNPRVNGVLQLFCGMLRYRAACARHVRDLARQIHRGDLSPELEAQENELYLNPRRANK